MLEMYQPIVNLGVLVVIVANISSRFHNIDNAIGKFNIVFAIGN